MMDISNTVRMQAMRGHSKEIRRLLLSDHMLEIARWAEARGEVTSAELADWLGCSTQNACMKLIHLHDTGYLRRSQRTAETGGIEYVYRITVER
jgi:transcription initiation factor IIE alpha subunit